MTDYHRSTALFFPEAAGRLQPCIWLGLHDSLLTALNRLSDLLFVLARIANDDGRSDVLWQGGLGLDGV